MGCGAGCGPNNSSSRVAFLRSGSCAIACASALSAFSWMLRGLGRLRMFSKSSGFMLIFGRERALAGL